MVADMEVGALEQSNRERGSVLLWVLIILVAFSGIALFLYWYYRPTIEWVGFGS